MKVLEYITFFLTIASGHAWRNSWDGVLNFKCDQHHGVYGSISRIASVHNNHREDRLWGYDCRYDVKTTSQCSWTNYVNGWDTEMWFQCPKSGYVAGAHSVHSNRHEDRIWKYFCCDLPRGYTLSHCYWTSYINGWDGALDKTIAPGRVIVGFNSHHSNHHEDRRWRIKECAINRGRSLNTDRAESEDFDREESIEMKEDFNRSDENEVEPFDMEQEDDEMKY